MIITKITSGLGNQLFQYALGRALATERRTSLYFDLSYYKYTYATDTPRQFKLDRFAIDYRVLNGSPLEYVSKATKLFPGRTCRPFFQLVRERHFHFDDTVLQARAAVITLDGFWQSERYFRPHEALIRRELAFANRPEPSFATYRDELARSRTPISVHIRRGDYVNHPEFSKTFGFVGVGYYEHALRSMQTRFPDARFFVFSDDQAWVRAHLSFPGDTVFVQHTGPDADVADLQLMSRCRHHVIANSSFSWWGAWLNPARDKVVVSPRQWYVNQPTWNTRDLLPEGWLTV